MLMKYHNPLNRHIPKKTKPKQRKRKDERRFLFAIVEAGNLAHSSSAYIPQYSTIPNTATSSEVIIIDLIMIILSFTGRGTILNTSVTYMQNSITLKISKMFSATFIALLNDIIVNNK